MLTRQEVLELQQVIQEDEGVFIPEELMTEVGNLWLQHCLLLDEAAQETGFFDQKPEERNDNDKPQPNPER